MELLYLALMMGFLYGSYIKEEENFSLAMEVFALAFSCQAPSLSCRLPRPPPQVKRSLVSAAFYSLRDSRPANQRAAFAAMRTH